ncbi:MAG: glycoside hydrolase family 2 protein [Solirubrobacteraceae bacterium]
MSAAPETVPPRAPTAADPEAGALVAVHAASRDQLRRDWQLLGSAPGEHDGPEALPSDGWISAQVPGTVAGALRAAGHELSSVDLDDRDWWFRTTFETAPPRPDERLHLCLDGLATITEVYLNGQRVLDSDSMFAVHSPRVQLALGAPQSLTVCCRALRPRLAERPRPRARWRTRLVSDGNLRFVRTMLIGRAPGLPSRPPVVGPYRSISIERRRGVSVDSLRLRATVAGEDGLVSIRALLEALDPGVAVRGATLHVGDGRGETSAALELAGGRDRTLAATGTVRVARPELWWPHTHGAPALHQVRLRIALERGEDVVVDCGRVGFRDLQVAPDLERDGLRLSINGVPLFARGAVWTPLDPDAPDVEEQLARVLQSVVDAGMNVVRVPGIACYESPAFLDLCDRLGLLLWQDFMFANLDYPEQDDAFMRTVDAEARQVLSELGPRPCTAVLCGGSEVAQQVAMLGLDSELARGPLFGELLPTLVGEADLQAPYIPSTPWGGDLPFRPDRGVANYYGVGAYLRPLEDARRSEVKFAAECLAFANVPDDAALDERHPHGAVGVGDGAWKRGVPRDVGAGWDFDDVRDHYLRLLFEVDPVALRSVDPIRYLELSRQVTGEVMAEVFGEWRRERSTCAGALVLWLADMRAGAGWGLLDSRGTPKVAFHVLARALAPVAVWSSDEGLGGVVAHVANDGSERLEATLRVSLYWRFETLVAERSKPVEIPPHGIRDFNVESLLGRFVDASWAYRFGPPAQHVIVLSLERPELPSPRRLLSQSCRFPSSWPLSVESAPALGLAAVVGPVDGEQVLTVSSRRFLYGVRATIPGFIAADDAFSVEPGHSRTVILRPASDLRAPTGGTLTAVNLSGRIAIEVEEPAQ